MKRLVSGHAFCLIPQRFYLFDIIVIFINLISERDLNCKINVNSINKNQYYKSVLKSIKSKIAENRKNRNTFQE